MIRFFVGLCRTIIVDVASTILAIYERSLLGPIGNSRFVSHSYKVSDVKTDMFSCGNLTVRAGWRSGVIHIDLRNALITVPNITDSVAEHKFSPGALGLINKCLVDLVRKRIVVTGDRISINYNGITTVSRNMLYKDSHLGTRKTIITQGDNRIIFTHPSTDFSHLKAMTVTALIMPGGTSEGSVSLPFTAAFNKATIIVTIRPNTLHVNATDMLIESLVKVRHADIRLNKYQLGTVVETEYNLGTKSLLVGLAKIVMTRRLALLINRSLRKFYPAQKRPPSRRNRPTGRILIDPDFLGSLSSDSDTASSASESSSMLRTQITMINEYIDTNPYMSYIPIVDKSAKNRELFIGRLDVQWTDGEWSASRLRVIDQQDNTYLEADDISVHHPGTFHMSRMPNSDRRAIVRIKKATNQLTICPFPIYLNSDLSAVQFGELATISILTKGVEMGSGMMYGHVTIEGFRIVLNIHTDITIGRIDINDADLEMGSWQIWCPANWGEVAHKYEGHIREQVYKDTNMKALLGKSPLSPIGILYSAIDNLRNRFI
jgi:hypothetical protein